MRPPRKILKKQKYAAGKSDLPPEKARWGSIARKISGGSKVRPGPGKSGPRSRPRPCRRPCRRPDRPGTTGPAPERCRPAPPPDRRRDQPPRSAAAGRDRRPDQLRHGWTSCPGPQEETPGPAPAPRSSAHAGQLQRPQEAHHAQRPRPGQTNSRRKSSAQAPGAAHQLPKRPRPGSREETPRPERPALDSLPRSQAVHAGADRRRRSASPEGPPPAHAGQAERNRPTPGPADRRPGSIH